MNRIFVLTLTLIALSLQSCNKNDPESRTAEQFVDSSSMKELPAQDQKISSLTLNFKQGDVFHYKLEQIEKLVQDDSMSVSSHTTAYYTKTILSSRDGITSFTIRYDSLKSLQSSKGMGPDDKDLSFNSNDSNDRKNKDYAMASAIIGEAVTVLVDKKGKIEEISGLTPIVNRVANITSKPIPENVKSQLVDQVRQMYFSQLVVQEQQSMPDSAIDATMSWSKSSTQDIPPVFTTHTAMKYTIAKVSSYRSRKVAEINATLMGDISLKDSKIPVSLKKGTISGEGNSLIDVENGYTLRKTASIKQELQASAMNPNTKQMDDFKQSKTSSLTVTLLK